MCSLLCKMSSMIPYKQEAPITPLSPTAVFMIFYPSD